MKGWRRVIDFIFFFVKRTDASPVPRPVGDTSEEFERVRRQHAEIERRIRALETRADVQSRGRR